MPLQSKADFDLLNAGLFFIITPLTDAARDWADENLLDAMEFGGGIAVEPRYVRDIVDGIVGDGLSVS